MRGDRLRNFSVHHVATCLVVCAAALPTAGLSAETLRLATGELPPYASVQYPDQGIALDIVRRAFAITGYEVNYTFKPWMRSLEEAREGKWDGTGCRFSSQ